MSQADKKKKEMEDGVRLALSVEHMGAFVCS